MEKYLDDNTQNYNRTLKLILIVVSLLLALSTYIDTKYKKDNINKEIVALEKNIIEEHKKRLEESVHSTIYHIDKVYDLILNQQKKDSKEATLSDKNYKFFENEIRNYLYNNIFEKVRYTWIHKLHDFKGGDKYATRLIHPNLKDTEGKLLSTKTQDIKGNLPYKEELEGIRANGEVFYTYYFKEYNKEKITRKISFAKFYKKLNWIIATGIPTSVLDAKIEEEKKLLLEEYEKNLTITLFIKALILLILALTFYLFRNKTNTYIFNKLSKSNEILNTTNEKLSVATKAANIGVWKWDIINDTLEWDELMYKLYEVEPSSLDKNYELWANCLFEEDKQRAQDELKNSIAQKKRFVSLFRINTKSGIKYIQAFGNTKYDKKGKALHIMGINFDLTKEKNQEKTILKQAQTLSDHVIYSRTDKKGIITDVSELFCKISGYSKKELIGKPHNVVRHPDSPKELFEDLWASLKAGKTWQGEIKNRNKDGSYYWVLSTMSLEYDNDGNFIGYISIRTDITNQKDLEQKQIQLMEQSKLASLGEMIGNIAHQWRQPLSVISTAATGIKMQQELNVLDPKVLDEELDMINDNAQHLSQTIDIFRDFIKEDKVFSDVILQDRIDGAFKILSASLKNNHINVVNNIDNSEPIKVKLIIGELSQVIMNIINNSKDALLVKKVKNPTIIIDLIKENDKVILTIEDNAGGIPEDVLPHVFEPYFTTKHQSQGTGLGLYMSFNIVRDSLKGKIYIKNTEIGAKTYIELPLNLD